MKKTILILLAVCLIIGGVVGYLSYSSANLQAQAAAPVETDAPAEAEINQVPDADASDVVYADTEPGETEDGGIPRVRSLDYAALYAAHEPDEVVAVAGDHEINWSEYFYMLFSQSAQVQDYFNTIAGYYGVAMDWEDTYDEETGETFIDVVLSNVDVYLKQQAAIEGFMKENAVELSEEDLAAIEETVRSDMTTALGEEATREEFDAFLPEVYLTPALYDRMNAINYLAQRGFIQLYGETGELMGDEAALAWLESQDYMAANHILLMTIDPSTGASLDEETIAQKYATAEELLAELRAITDPEELVARFLELKEEYDEDTGKLYYPDGYVFTPGTMVSEFEAAVLAMDAYGLSDIVESSYGYHIILRMPLSADSVIEYSSAGTPLTARSEAANEEYGRRLQEYLDNLSLDYTESFTKPDLAAFLA